MKKLTCFKAYDIRGKLGEELNEDIAWRIGRAYGEFLKPKTIVLGGDVRLTSETLKLALAKGLQDAGVDVLDIGMSGTEEIYFATFHLGVDGGIEVTASHNPMDYNGMKLVREGARPISGDTGLRDVQRLAEANDFPPVDETKRGRYQQINLRDAYVDHLFGYINVKNLTPLKLVINSGNGAAGPVVDAIEARFKALGAPVELIKVHNTPDGNFPNGIPNPLLPECRDDTRNAVIKHGADMGIAFDGDFDRCFLFDEKGQFIEGYYIVGLLAEAFLEKNPGAKIIHDPRLSWNTVDVVTAAGGTPVMSKTGHAFIKERMRKEDAIYGGEMSAHHYFRDFAYCDSGMIPWLLVAELVCLKGKTLGELVRDRMAAFPASGEINSKLAHPVEAINRVEQHFSREALAVDRTDGISMTFADWRFNLRSSNTEPVVRLNVESRGDVPTTVGVKDLVVVQTKDAVLIADRNAVQDVKKVVEQIKADGRHEHRVHREVYRPWGKYDSIDAGDRYQVKRITVKPGEGLSVQMHYHRAEHWVVVAGTAKVTINGDIKLLGENESIYIPLGAMHCLENPGKIDLELIEVRSGAYLEEDDVIRCYDRYGRK
ncbi:TPA: phosphomannomutase CpsG [Escherichia coli]